MIFLAIIIVLYILFFCFPAFMLTWEFNEYPSSGCSEFLCVLVGLPGAILALLIKAIVYLCKLPNERKLEKERQIQEQQEQERKKREREKAEKRQREYQKSLIEKREKIYPNSPVTREIVRLLMQNGKVPYAIEVSNTGLSYYFEDRTGSYVFRAHDLPNMTSDEEMIFANVLNQKLGNIYKIEEKKKFDRFTYSDGTVDYIPKHVCIRMERKVVRNF